MKVGNANFVSVLSTEITLEVWADLRWATTDLHIQTSRRSTPPTCPTTTRWTCQTPLRPHHTHPPSTQTYRKPPAWLLPPEA